MSTKEKIMSILISAIIALVVPVCIVQGIGGHMTFDSYYKNKDVSVIPLDFFIVEVKGSVMHEGSYRVRSDTTYGQLFNLAVLHKNSIYTQRLDDYVNPRKILIMINYIEDNKMCYVININNKYFKRQALLIGIDENIIETIENFKLTQTNNKINIKTILQSILTEDEYNSVYYKIFV